MVGSCNPASPAPLANRLGQQRKTETQFLALASAQEARTELVN
jgi:hypothetical protein